jgi:hypothetical protein
MIGNVNASLFMHKKTGNGQPFKKISVSDVVADVLKRWETRVVKCETIFTGRKNTKKNSQAFGQD